MVRTHYRRPHRHRDVKRFVVDELKGGRTGVVRLDPGPDRRKAPARLEVLLSCDRGDALESYRWQEPH